MQAVKIIHGAVSVKKAFLMQTDTGYALQHYDTIILEIEGNTITKIYPNISQSSNRAINQALSYLGFNVTTKDFRKSTDRLGYNMENRADYDKHAEVQAELKALINKE